MKRTTGITALIIILGIAVVSLGIWSQDISTYLLDSKDGLQSIAAGRQLKDLPPHVPDCDLGCLEDCQERTYEGNPDCALRCCNK